MKVAICITTRNRPVAYKKVVDQIKKHTVSPYSLITVEDASDQPYSDGFRFEHRQGIPKAKNKCLELASDFDKILLFDDDVFPIKNGWELPYTQSKKEHLCYTFLPSYKRVDKFRYHVLGNGCMMYVTRKCIDTIGGFDTRFGMGKYEHVNFSRRAKNAGLIDHPFIDVLGSKILLYSMDENSEIERSFSDKELKELLESGKEHFQETVNSKEYLPYY